MGIWGYGKLNNYETETDCFLLTESIDFLLTKNSGSLNH